MTIRDYTKTCIYKHTRKLPFCYLWHALIGTQFYDNQTHNVALPENVPSVYSRLLHWELHQFDLEGVQFIDLYNSTIHKFNSNSRHFERASGKTKQKNKEKLGI